MTWCYVLGRLVYAAATTNANLVEACLHIHNICGGDGAHAGLISIPPFIASAQQLLQTKMPAAVTAGCQKMKELLRVTDVQITVCAKSACYALTYQL